MTRAAIVIVLCAVGGVAHGYPQYQLGKEATCSQCHIAPAGGGLLDGMGPLLEEEQSTWGGNPEFLHGAVGLPEWLFLGGDLRSAGGLNNRGSGTEPVFVPMQYEVHGAIHRGNVTGYATIGATIPKKGEPINALLLREHWVMYGLSDRSVPGMYVRVGRFMPTYGLRHAEHVLYTRRYGGTPLYGETYSLAVGYVSPGFEVHLTGFLRDRLRDDFALEKADGAALYAEKRIADKAAIGVEWRFGQAPDEWRAQGGLTGKYWFASPSIQISAEAQVIHQVFSDGGSRRNQLVGYLMGSWQGAKGFLVDLGLGHYDEDLSIKKVDRDCIDLNVHWFPYAHVELVLMHRLQTIGFGDGGESSYYSLLQVHYRL